MIDQEVALVQQSSRRVKEEISDILEEVDTVQNDVKDITNSRYIRGKKLSDWDKDFSLTIDYQINPVQVNMLLSRLSGNLDTATGNYNQAKFERSVYNNYFNKEARLRVETEANKKGKKAPSLSMMEKLAEAALGSKTLVRDYYDFEVDFWEKMVSKVNAQIKLINILTISNGTRYKLEV